MGADFGDLQIGPVTPRPDDADAARRAIAWRYQRGLLTNDETLTVLLALGLAHHDPNINRYVPWSPA